MLVLSRKQDDRIVIGDEITVTVVEIRKGRVKLGISAPREVAVNRQEILQKAHRHVAAAGVPAR